VVVFVFPHLLLELWFMNKNVIVLAAEDDDGHFALIKKNLRRSGISNQVLRFSDGQQILEYLFERDLEADRNLEISYLLLLDIRMPKVDGVDVLTRIKKDPEYKKIPVIMLTTTDDPKEISRCHELGCSIYIVKPVEYESFVDAIQRVGLFLSIVEVPSIQMEMA
jgi:CheY-like chemotaxis protein